jgi:hypothetical protein
MNEREFFSHSISRGRPNPSTEELNPHTALIKERKR